MDYNITKEDIIRMAREVLLLDERDSPNDDGIAQFIGTLTDFAALVAAAERQKMYKRRGTVMFDPYCGTPRHPSDIESDPHAILLLDPEQPIRAQGETK